MTAGTTPSPSSSDAYQALNEARRAYSEVLAGLTRHALTYIAAITAELAPDVAFIEVEHGDQDDSGYHIAIGYVDAAGVEVPDTSSLDDDLADAEVFTDLDDATAHHYREFIVERDGRRFLDLGKVREKLG